MYAKLLLLTFLLASCASPQIALFSLDAPGGIEPAQNQLPLTLSVGQPGALPGYDTSRMAYVVKPHQIEYFSKNQWVDSPGKMLLPILVRTLSQRFRAVVKSPARGDMRLDSEIVMLRQEFSESASRVHLVVRAQILDRRGVMTTREFDIFENCPQNDPYGGVLAANRAVARLAVEISDFCAASHP
ncbi:MAG: PqiC family protein [Burkholderiales bacterium]|nr:PqiC family protein [Burkholderiales bacterium]